MNSPIHAPEDLDTKEVTEMPIFFHEWITYDSEKHKFTFSDEAKIALQKYYSSFNLKISDTKEKNKGIKKITNQNVNVTLASLIAKDASIKTIDKFKNWVKELLKKKESTKARKKTKKKVLETINQHIEPESLRVYFEYTEKEQHKKSSLPIIITPESDIDQIISSLNTRSASKEVFVKKNKQP